ncbi:MAG: PKD domain-containing protein [Melioribacteraceae bacterium]|nr:PKD domain-containing protein [Melioribacteraceae bacterium]
MKKIFLLLAFFLSVLNAQTELRFINYGLRADPSEGDDNFIQVINIKLPQGYMGQAFLRLFDMSCGSSMDVPLGRWDSRFRFSIYRNEITEEQIRLIPGYKAEIYPNVISHFETGHDPRHFNSWYTFVDLAKYGSDGSIYSLVVEGVEGNDGNAFEIYVSPDSLNNIPISGTKIYSYEPTLSLRRISNKISFRTTPQKDDNEITVHTFDFDGTRTYFSSLLKNEIPNREITPTGWSRNKYDLTVYERDNYSTLDIGPQGNPVNDITFYFTGSDGRRKIVELPAFEKVPAEIPLYENKISYLECESAKMELIEKTSYENRSHEYLWKFKDGVHYSDKFFTRNFSSPGRYEGEVFVLDNNSTAITRAMLEKFLVIINDKPTAEFKKNIVAAPNEKIVFDASGSFDRDGKILRYDWEFGDGTTGTGMSIARTYPNPGKYPVRLKVTDDYFLNECNCAVDTSTVVINSKPAAVTKDKVIGSVNEEIVFDASSSHDNDGEIILYAWDVKGFAREEGKIIKKKFLQPGKYSGTLTVRDNSTASNNTNLINFEVVINNPPKAVAGSNRIIALNEEIVFDGSKSVDSDGMLVEYKWNLGDGTIFEGVKTSHSYSKFGKYKVFLTVKDNSKTTSDTSIDSLVVIVNQAPVALAGSDLYLDSGNASFDGSKSYDEDGEITKYEWDLGDGSRREGKTFNHLYKTTGEYRVILKVTDNTNTRNNFAFDTITVVVNRRPIADAGPDHLIAPNQKLTFTSANSRDPDGQIIKQRWFVDNKPVSEDKILEYTFIEPRTYLVGLEVTDDFPNPLSDIDFVIVKINEQPVAVIDGPQIGEPQKKIKFSAERSFDKDGKIIEYSWLIDDLPVKKGKVIEHSFDKPGIHRVVLNVMDDASVSNSITGDTLNIKINSSPLIVVQEIIETCDNVVTIDASGSIDPDGDQLTFYWQFPNSNRTKGSAVITHHFQEKGILPVMIYADDAMGLSNSITQKSITVKINRPPVADAGKDTTVCAGDFIVFNGLKSFDPENGLLKYVWIIGDSLRMEGSNVVHKFRIGGVYRIKLIVTDDSGLPCNTGEDHKIITVIEAPVANAGPDQIACANSPVQFDGTKSTDVDGIVNTFEWDFGDGEFGGGAAPVHIYPKPGVYKVTLTITGDLVGDCDNTDKDEMVVTVVEAPIASFEANTLLAEKREGIFDASKSLTSSGSIVRYEWNFGDGNFAEGKIVKHAYYTHGKYRATLKINTDSGGECSSSNDSKLITVNSQPVAVANAMNTAAVNQLIEFAGSESYDKDGEINNYNWQFEDGTKKEGVKINHSFDKGGKHNIVLRVEDNSAAENNFAYDTLIVLVNNAPSAVFDLPEYVYRSFDFELNGSKSYDPDGNINTYEWYLDDKKISGDKILKYRINTAGNYRVRLVVTDNSSQLNSINEISKYLLVADYPSAIIPERGMVCINESFSISPEIINAVNDPSIKFRWLTKEGDVVGNNKNFLRKINRSGEHVYYMEIFNSSNFVYYRDSAIIKANTPPMIETMKDRTIYIGTANDEVTISANATDEDGDYLSYTWAMGDGTISTKPIVIHKYGKEGVYKVTLTIDDGKKTSCSKISASFNIMVLKAN